MAGVVSEQRLLLDFYPSLCFVGAVDMSAMVPEALMSASKREFWVNAM